MGVPGYFKWVVQHCPGVMTKDLEVDCLYVDMNGILHPACHNDGNSINGNSEEAMLSNFCLKLDEIIFATQPKKLIYFAFDGPAPYAKMVQQRSRRFCSRYNLRLQVKMYKRIAEEWKKEGLPVPEMPSVWDSNNITPGTPFMMKVRKTVESYISDRISDPAWKNYQDIIWLLSDSGEPGEGEHKLIQFIKKQKCHAEYDPKTTHCLVGMDADLIQLALSAHDPNIIIYRDESFISINMVREYFRACFSPILTNPGIHESLRNFERLLDDLLLCFAFVGNDFLPPLPQLKISSNAIGRCLSVYIGEFQQIGEFLTNAGTINTKALELYIKALCSALENVPDPSREVVNWYDKIERAYFNETQQFEGQSGSTEPMFWSAVRRRTELYAWKKTATLYFHDKVCVGVPEWQNRYYSEHWSDEAREKDCLRDQVNIEYMRGLQWVQRYYHDDCPDWEWHYPYRYGPSLDCLQPSKVHEEDMTFTTPGIPLDPLQQLLIVVPREGAERLLPKRFVNLMYEDLRKYFPNRFKIDYSNCPPKWMTQAILPTIDLEHVRMITIPWYLVLSKQEIKLNERVGMRMFVHVHHRIAEEYDVQSPYLEEYFPLQSVKHSISGSIFYRQTSTKSKKLTRDAVRFQYKCPSSLIRPIYFDKPPSEPNLRLIDKKNSFCPLSYDNKIKFLNMKGFTYDVWGITVDSTGKLTKPPKEESLKVLTSRKRKFRSGDYDDYI